MLKLGQFSIADLDRAYVCVIQLKTQPQYVIHQVTLRPDKVHKSITPIIRLGETQGDEAAGWQYPNSIQIIAILGHSVREPTDGQTEKWKCIPIEIQEAA